MTDYPATISIDDMIAIVKDRGRSKQDMALALWNIQGYAQSLIIGAPQSGPAATPRLFGSGPPQTPSDEEAAAALTRLKVINDDPTKIQMNPLVAEALMLLLKWSLMKALELV